LYRLLAHPEYIEPLREEVEAVVAEEGWTKAAMDKMHKIDSFVRETQRLGGLTIGSFPSVQLWIYELLMPVLFYPVVMTRLVLRPFTFSNGVTIPAGTHIAVPASATHTDERIYENPNEFDGFRFAKLRESEGYAVRGRHQVISTSADNLSFGLGRHAW